MTGDRWPLPAEARMPRHDTLPGRSYVVGFLRIGPLLVLVQKERPEWQRGKLNGIGGKIEHGESAYEAMCRKFEEETGIRFTKWDVFARVQGPGESTATRELTGHGPPYDVWIFKGVLDQVPALPKKNDAGEILMLCRMDSIASRHDVVSNLKWLIPLAFEDGGKPFAYVLDTIAPGGTKP